MALSDVACTNSVSLSVFSSDSTLRELMDAHWGAQSGASVNRALSSSNRACVGKSFASAVVEYKGERRKSAKHALTCCCLIRDIIESRASLETTESQKPMAIILRILTI